VNQFKPIAIYLPQFHPIPENDQWWGKGFTEWTNVTKAKPLFKGHYQPHLPSDLGFYDLRLDEARLAQETLAKDYAIYGFCYYHYWFNGKRILHEPLDRKLQNPKEDLPFMICWANENWTRAWDGSNKEILLEQKYSSEDAQAFAEHLIPYFKDARYIRNNGKVIFAIYRSDIIPNILEYIEAIKKECSRNNIEIEISRVESFAKSGTEFMKGFDSAIEFQPFSPLLSSYVKDNLQPIYNRKFATRLLIKFFELIGNYNYKKKTNNRIFNQIEYAEYIDYLIDNYKIPSTYKRYPCVTPSWDNTARRKKYESFLFKNASPQFFYKWLAFIVHTMKKKEYTQLNNFVFINAWNEWAEGNHLEPCVKFGLDYLNVVKKIVS